MTLTIHQYNTRKADINRHAEAALAGLEQTAVSQKLSTAEIIKRAHAIGVGQSRDMAKLEREFESNPG